MIASADSNLSRRHRLIGFTLVELMISIALVLILVLGVNKVFKTVADTVGTGAILATTNRDSQAAKQVFSDDLRSALPDSPVFVIDNRQSYAFDNADDAANAIVPSDPTNGNQIPAAVYNDHNHRIDRIGFFMRGNFHRQTANDGAMASADTSTDAFVWYGHVAMPNQPTPTHFTGPDADYATFFSSGRVTWNNGRSLAPAAYQYASQWILGRELILLKHPNSIPAVEDYLLAWPTPAAGPPPYQKSDTKTQNPLWLAPIVGFDPSNLTQNNPGANQQRSELSRFDLGGTSLDLFRGYVSNAVQYNLNNAGAIPWWQPLILYYDYGAPTMAGFMPLRFACNPLPIKPITSESAAQLSPYFIGHVSQFIVEFAGDFITQDSNPTSATYGNTLAAGADGQTDFVVDRTGPVPIQKIRWYGLPRDLNGDGRIDANDVVPVRDLEPGQVAQPFEKAGPAYPAGGDYQPVYGSKVGNGFTANDSTFNYSCVWQSGGPTYVRIIYKIDDPNGQMQNGPTYEYVFKVGP